MAYVRRSQAFRSPLACETPLFHSIPPRTEFTSTRVEISCLGLLLHYNRQGRKAEDLRSRGNPRTQRARNTGTNNRPTAPNASKIVTNDHFYVSPHRGPQPLASPLGALALLHPLVCGTKKGIIHGSWRYCTLCRHCMLVGAEHVVLLRPLSSVPLAFLATSRCQASSICFVWIDSLLVHLLFSGAVTIDRSSCFTSDVRCNPNKGIKASTIRVRRRNHQPGQQHSSTRSGTPRQHRTGDTQRRSTTGAHL